MGGVSWDWAVHQLIPTLLLLVRFEQTAAKEIGEPAFLLRNGCNAAATFHHVPESYERCGHERASAINREEE
jgi:predicted ATPase